jgi:hypothetical protein
MIMRLLLFLMALTFTTNCGSNLKTIDSSSYLSNPVNLEFLSGPNVMNISINGSTCGNVLNSSSLNLTPTLNSLCASVTICDTNASNCQKISGLRIDTVHAGLRIFKSAINSSTLTALTPVQVSSKNLAILENLSSTDILWGSIYQAKITLGGQTTPNLTTLQIIDNGTLSTGSDQSAAGSSLLTTLNSITSPASNFTLITAPNDTYTYNGILGIGPEQYRCINNASCLTDTNNNRYFACETTNHTCTSTTATYAQQLINPIMALSENNNGAIISLPSTAPGGSSSKNGYLILGIDTQSNNTSTGMTAFSCSNYYSELTTSLQGTIFSSSRFQTLNNQNLIASNIPASPNSPNYYMPYSVQTLKGSILGTNSHLDFQIYIGNSLIIATNYQNYATLSVFSEFAMYNNKSTGYDAIYGLPFFLGRNVFIGFENSRSNLGSGKYYAF